MTASKRCRENASRRASRLRTSTLTNSGALPAICAIRPSTAAWLLQRLSRTKTSYPACISATEVWDPMNPAPPVTMTFITVHPARSPSGSGLFVESGDEFYPTSESSDLPSLADFGSDRPFGASRNCIPPFRLVPGGKLAPDLRLRQYDVRAGGSLGAAV